MRQRRVQQGDRHGDEAALAELSQQQVDEDDAAHEHGGVEDVVRVRVVPEQLVEPREHRDLHRPETCFRRLVVQVRVEAEERVAVRLPEDAEEAVVVEVEAEPADVRDEREDRHDSEERRVLERGVAGSPRGEAALRGVAIIRLRLAAEPATSDPA